MGTLYDVDDEGLVRIDRKEGSGWTYQRQPVQVALTDGTLHDAITYTVLEREPAEIAPSARYLDGLIRAAHQRGLPPTYLELLDSLPARFA